MMSNNKKKISIILKYYPMISHILKLHEKISNNITLYKKYQIILNRSISFQIIET